jgi:cytochrome c-type biogenesis protein
MANHFRTPHGAATTLASQGRNLTRIAFLMLIFGIGAAAPLVLLGSLSHRHR